jgi:hypothetical protein
MQFKNVGLEKKKSSHPGYGETEEKKQQEQEDQ